MYITVYLYELIGSLAPQCECVVTVMVYQCWAEDCISLVALAKLAQLVLTKRVGSAIL